MDDALVIIPKTRDVHSVDSVDLSLRPQSARGGQLTSRVLVEDENRLVTSGSSREFRRFERDKCDEDVCLRVPVRIGIALLLAVLMGLVMTLCILLTIRPYKGILY